MYLFPRFKMKVTIPYALAAIGSLVTLTQAQGLEDDACPVEISTEPTCAPTMTTLIDTEAAPASTVTVTKPATTVTVRATVRASSRCSIPVPSQTSTTTTPTPSNAPCPVRPDCPPMGLNIDYYSNPFGFNIYTSTTAGQSARQVLPPSYYITEGLTPISFSLTNVTYIPQDYASDVAGYPEVYANPSEAQVPYYVGYKRGAP